MKEFLSVIKTSPLFFGISEDEILEMLTCLDAKKASYKKSEFILRSGDSTEAIGLMLSGSVLIIQDDIWGNRNILSKIGPGQTFAAAFACAPGAVLNVTVAAETDVTVMFLNVKRVLNICSSACTHHGRIVRNLLGELAQKNLRSGEKLTHMGQRSTRAKRMSYFSSEVQRSGGYEFDIPFSRQQLADYLAVERSGLSNELCKMRDEVLIEFNKNHFKLKL